MIKVMFDGVVKNMGYWHTFIESCRRDEENPPPPLPTGFWKRVEENIFGCEKLKFQVAVAKKFTESIGIWMHVMFEHEIDTSKIKAKNIAWRTLNSAAQLIETPEELESLKLEYQKLMTIK